MSFCARHVLSKGENGMVRPMPHTPLPFHLIPFDFRFSLFLFFFYSFICVYVCFPLPMFVIPIYVSRKGMLGFNKLHLKTNILVFWFGLHVYIIDGYTKPLATILNSGPSWSILYTLCLFSFLFFFFACLKDCVTFDVSFQVN